MPGFDRANLMVAIGVERDQRELAAVPADGDPLVAMLDFDGATRKVRGQDHDQRANHVVGLLGIAVGGEELARSIDEHVVQRRLEAGAVTESEIAPHVLEERPQRFPPARFVDLDTALRDLPGVWYLRIKPRLSLQAVASRPRNRAEPTRHGACDRPSDAANALHVEAQVVGCAGPTRGKRARCLDAREQLAHVLQRGHRSSGYRAMLGSTLACLIRLTANEKGGSRTTSMDVEKLSETPSCRGSARCDIAGDFVLVEHAPDGCQESRQLLSELGMVLGRPWQT